MNTDDAIRDPARRDFLRAGLRAGAFVGCSVAAQPFLSRVTLAAAPGEGRLVVLILRGAMDGLDVVRPVGDPAFAGYRKATLEGGAAIPLTGIFAMHPDLAPLSGLWKAGELGFVHAVSTPYRDKRSHFDGQDILEAGSGLDVPDHALRDGWLNRMLQRMPGLKSETAFSVGRDEMKVIMGPAPYGAWAPDARLGLLAQSSRLLEAVYHDDPLFRDAAGEAIRLTDELARARAQRRHEGAAMAAGAPAGMMMAPGGNAAPGTAAGGGAVSRPDPLALFAASRLRGETRIAAFSISGWDSHAGQRGLMRRELGRLSDTILTLRAGLGPVWSKTLLIAMTEFGRTARENGSGGTDHGTGGVAVLAGGALRGGRVYGRWPGLGESALYQRRDLMPTADVRLYPAWAMRGLYGLDRGVLENTVFPRLDMGTDPRILL